MLNSEKQILKLQAAAELTAGNIIAESFIELVRDEVACIKVYATTAELGRLNILRFNARLNNNCVYGQLTGNCNSTRAIELLNLCAVPFSTNLRWFELSNKENFNERLNHAGLICCSALEYYVSNIGKQGVKQLMDEIQTK